MQRNSVSRAVAACLCLAGTALTASAYAAVDQDGFHALLKAGVYFIDNPFAVPPGQPKHSDVTGRFSPELGYTHVTDRTEIDLNYTLDAVQYASSDGLNSAQHQAIAKALWKALPEWLSLEVNAKRFQQSADPLGRSRLDGLLGDTNAVDVTAASFVPRLRHEFGHTTLQGYYEVSRTKYDWKNALLAPTQLRDANDQNGYAAFGTTRDDGAFSWKVAAEHQRTTYGTAALQPFQYDKLNAQVGVPVGARWTALAAVGVETNISQSSSKGGLDSNTWEVGARWNGPQGKTRLEVAVGERFFGKSFRAEFIREAKLLTLKGSYLETPTTETARLTRAVPVFAVGTDTPINDPFLLKQAEFSATLNGSRTSLTFGGYDQRRQFIATPLRGDDTRRGLTGRVVRHLSSRMDLAFDGSWTQVKVDGSGQFKEAEGGLELSREVGRNTALILGARRWHRAGAEPFKVIAGYLQVAMRF